ncbi:hypothetical protein F3I62_18870 [Pseudomonas sp. R-28-1W-6]|uniref:hypothetical protein n=1 Tax=Pseudomonas sp. R-28-1W-6 TaxID=2650101 RepID=UPI0013666BAC|nr:hypothetical protein [Pseudomonas sp. R-28-1W-6]MWV14168.1 hypothetical protein [Pseudomonas sp. R-28-1W-6]
MKPAIIRAVGCALILALAAASVFLNKGFCGGDFQPCPIEQGPELDRMSEQLKGIISPATAK